jgi:hypothetical protein
VTGIIWTNRMTEVGAEKYLSPDDYVIQIWTTKSVIINFRTVKHCNAVICDFR